MKLWISRNSEVPVAEQLTTQIMLAIHSGELRPNQKLPSTRELARRFGLYSNTVNSAYRDLARRGWLHFKKGSGVYVRGLVPDVPQLFRAGRGRGLSLAGLLTMGTGCVACQGSGCSPIQCSRCPRKNWQNGLRSSVAVTDVVTAAQLPTGCRSLLLNVIAESSLQELRRFVDQFLGSTQGMSPRKS